MGPRPRLVLLICLLFGEVSQHLMSVHSGSDVGAYPSCHVGAYCIPHSCGCNSTRWHSSCISMRRQCWVFRMWLTWPAYAVAQPQRLILIFIVYSLSLPPKGDMLERRWLR